MPSAAAVKLQLTQADEIRLLSDLLKQNFTSGPEGKDTGSLRPWAGKKRFLTLRSEVLQFVSRKNSVIIWFKLSEDRVWIISHDTRWSSFICLISERAVLNVYTCNCFTALNTILTLYNINNIKQVHYGFKESVCVVCLYTY